MVNLRPDEVEIGIAEWLKRMQESDREWYVAGGRVSREATNLMGAKIRELYTSCLHHAGKKLDFIRMKILDYNLDVDVSSIFTSKHEGHLNIRHSSKTSSPGSILTLIDRKWEAKKEQEKKARDEELRKRLLEHHKQESLRQFPEKIEIFFQGLPIEVLCDRYSGGNYYYRIRFRRNGRELEICIRHEIGPPYLDARIGNLAPEDM